ncbi:MAG: hypothetical protein KDA41_17315 [Planctomycetales bacterium]|nr:hypothetical protein [Planctomycetales bacterium]
MIVRDGKSIIVDMTPEEIAAANPPPSIDDVRAETARRLMVRFGARDREHLAIKFQDATARGAWLKDKLDRDGLTADEQAEADYLRRAVQDWFAIKAVGNALEALPKIPADFAADSNWP